MSERVKAAIRLIVALVPVANIILVQYGLSPLPFTEAEVNSGLSSVVAVAGILYAWWKNNNISPEAISLQPTLVELKRLNKEDKVGGEGDECDPLNK